MQCFHFQKQKTNWLRHKYCKMKPLSGASSHGASNESEAYLEFSQTSTREPFSKKKLMVTSS